MLPFVVGFLVLSILLFAIPVNLVYALKRDSAWRGRVIVYWMFGLVQLSFRPGRKSKAQRAKRRRRARRLIASGSKGLLKRRQAVSAALRSPSFLLRLIALVRDLLQAAKPRRLRIRFVVGMEDPADTGRLAGILAPLRLLFGKRTFGKASNVSIEVTPDFSGPRFKGYSCASVQFVPLQMAGLFLGFVLSAPVFRAARAWIRRSRLCAKAKTQ